MHMNCFETSDFILATTLATLSFKLMHIDRSNDRRASFCFERSDGIDQVVQDFWKADGLLIEPKAFAMNQRLLKSRLYAKDEANT